MQLECYQKGRPSLRPPTFLSGISRTGTTSRTSIAYDALKNSIISNQVKPGDYLSENQLALSLGMSRTPIREAIKLLAGEGFLEIHNGVGIFVKQVTTREISDLFEVRAALECAALHTSLDNITENEIDDAIKEWTKLKIIFDANQEIDINHMLDLDVKLHLMIIDRCKNEFLKNLIDGIRSKISRYQKISVMALSNTRDTIDQHLEILHCMKKRDSEVTSVILREHIRKAALYIINSPNWVVPSA